jgi:hypothetical protein
MVQFHNVGVSGAPLADSVDELPESPGIAPGDARNKIHLSSLTEGMPGLTQHAGGYLAEAAAVCFELQNHSARVVLPPTGILTSELEVEWHPVNDQARRTHADTQEATEFGACGVAILVVKASTGLVVFQRSVKGTGHDYWLGYPDDGDEDDDVALPFEGVFRLEVTGTLSGSEKAIEAKLKKKLDQMKPSDHVADGYAAVVEFEKPIARVVKKCQI